MPETPQTVRAFIAIRVGDRVERAIADVIDELRRPDDGIKWVSTANLHLTLKFLGPAVVLGKLEPLGRELEKIAAGTDPFEIEVAELGAFPDLKRPRVLWVGLRSGALMELAGAVERAAERCGFAREQRPFAAHLTIARVRQGHGWRRTRRALEQVRERRFGVCKAAEMTLYSSTLTPEGSVYEALKTYSFNREAVVEG